MKKKLIYVGNNISNGNPTTMLALSKLLIEAGFSVSLYGKFSNKVFRILEMFFGILKHRKSDYLLIDTYSTYNFYYAYFSSQLAKILGLKYVCILHGGDIPKRLQTSQRISKAIFKNATALVAPSGYLKAAFKKYGYDVTQIPNPIHISNYQFENKTYDTPKILWVRALQDIYNPLMAIRVLKEIQKEFPEATLTMVGPDKDGSLKACWELTHKLDLNDSIEFRGYLTKEEWISLSKKCNVFINTTNYDNTPVSVIEAMALGLPIVSTNVGGVPYLIEHTKTGVLVDKNDHIIMAKEVFRLFENPNVTMEMTKAARKKAEQSDAKRVGELWNELLHNAK